MLYSLLTALTSPTALTLYAALTAAYAAARGIAYAWRHRHGGHD